MRDLPDFVEIYPVCQPSAVLPDISLISLSIRPYLELTIFREDFSSVASVNVRFSWVFYFVFICYSKLNSPHYIIMGASPGLFSLGAFPTFRSHDFRHGCLYVESSVGGREDWRDSLPSSLENFWKFLVWVETSKKTLWGHFNGCQKPNICQCVKSLSEMCVCLFPFFVVTIQCMLQARTRWDKFKFSF